MDESILKEWASQALGALPYPDPRFPPSPYYRFLKILAMNLKPGLSVELGVCGGGGSFYLATGFVNGTVVGVDIADDHRENIDFVLGRCHNFRFWVGDSIKAAPRVYQEYGQVGILFIDTVHTYSRTLAEYRAWEPYLAEGAAVCFDDLLRPEMVGFWEDLPGNKLRLDQLHDGAESGGGFGVLWF
ncbi:MAG: class I SAM-dependent methyltransferase, partial [Nitrospiria bacterium]